MNYSGNSTARKTGRKSQHSKACTSRQLDAENEPTVEINMKFGSNIESIKYGRNDDIAAIAQELAIRNSTSL